MIRVTVHRKFADRSPSLSVSLRRGFRTFENAANSAMRLLADAARLLDLNLHDHIIIGNGTGAWVSLAERGLI